MLLEVEVISSEGTMKKNKVDCGYKKSKNGLANRISFGCLCEVVVGGLQESLVHSRVVQVMTRTSHDHGQVFQFRHVLWDLKQTKINTE